MDALTQILGRLNQSGGQTPGAAATPSQPVEPSRTQLQRRMQAGRPGLPRGMGKPGEITVKFPVDVLMRRPAPVGVDEETSALLKFMQQVDPSQGAELPGGA